MEPVDPCVPLTYLPSDSRAVVLAEHQQEYQSLPSVQTPKGSVISRWTFTDEERARIAAGEDLYLTVYTFGHRPQPVCLSVGILDWRDE
jgi:hypothetical protein